MVALLLGLFVAPGAAVLGATNEAARVVVLYNTRDRDSRDVAEFYAQQRGIPDHHLIGLTCSHATIITRSDYEKQVAEPLREQLEARGLAKFSADVVPSAGDQLGTVRYRLANSRIRYLVPVFGMPYRIAHDTNRVDKALEKVPAHMRNNGAALDNELMLLPADGLYSLSGPANNPLHGATNSADLHPGAGVFLVSRLDGPSAELAKGLVTKAMQAERDGLWGRAYFDLRGLKNGAYKLGDEWIGNAASIARNMGFDTYVDNKPATLSVGFPLSEVALYAGWYDAEVSGPFTLPVVEFAPGAIAYHLHSFSAYSPRNANKNWVGPLVSRGATVTMGCVDEPFLQLTPNVGIFFARLAVGFNVAEAFLAATPSLSWQNISVGDPLYRPFRPNPLERGREMNRTNSPLLPWALVQTINFQLNQGRSVDEAIKALEDLPGTTSSPVLSERLARLYEEKSRIRQAITFGQYALAAGGTPQQRVRLLLDLAKWQRTLDRSRDAFETLEQFAQEFPGHPQLLAARRDQLSHARRLDLDDDVSRLQAEIERLTPPPPAPKTEPGSSR